MTAPKWEQPPEPPEPPEPIRVWAEPESDGEAYIPLAADQLHRSREAMREMSEAALTWSPTANAPKPLQMIAWIRRHVPPMLGLAILAALGALIIIWWVR